MNNAEIEAIEKENFLALATSTDRSNRDLARQLQVNMPHLKALGKPKMLNGNPVLVQNTGAKRILTFTNIGGYARIEIHVVKRGFEYDCVRAYAVKDGQTYNFEVDKNYDNFYDEWVVESMSVDFDVYVDGDLAKEWDKLCKEQELNKFQAKAAKNYFKKPEKFYEWAHEDAWLNINECLEGCFTDSEDEQHILSCLERDNRGDGVHTNLAKVMGFSDYESDSFGWDSFACNPADFVDMLIRAEKMLKIWNDSLYPFLSGLDQIDAKYTVEFYFENFIEDWESYLSVKDFKQLNSETQVAV